MRERALTTLLGIAKVGQSFAAALIWLVAVLPIASRAQPAALRGKSIILSWQDARTVKDTATEQVHDTTQTSSINLYVSSTGRVFSEIIRQSGRGGSKENSGVSDAGSHQFLNWKFEGSSLIADQSFVRGARRVVIDFSGGFKSCSVGVLHGKEAGSQAIAYRNFSRPTQIYEILSIKVTATSCAVHDGNVFAAPNVELTTGVPP